MKQRILTLLSILSVAQSVTAATVAVQNHSFENTTGQSDYNEFTFGRPTGWEIYDPNDIHPSSGLSIGTLQPNGMDFFNSTAPDGDKVAILYNRTRIGEGEYGLFQLLGETLAPNTSYNLQVEVGNIATGTDFNGTYYNLNDFPGYRVEIMVGNTMADAMILSADNNTLNIAEAEFATSSVSFSTGSTHARMGQNLGIRLVSENIAHTDAGIINEVDFDDVRFSASPVPEPHSAILLGLSLLAACRRRSRK